MPKPVSIYNEIVKLNDSLMLFGGNLPKTNVMLRRQSERVVDLCVDMLILCSEALQEDNLNERVRYLRTLKTNLLAVDVIVKIWYNLPKKRYSKNYPIAISQSQYAVYSEIFSNILYSVKRWIKTTETQTREGSSKMGE